MAQLADYERLGSFYLGRLLRADGSVGSEPLLYEAKDLTTHAVCLGMTGSGKTGLCVSLLEEAALDGIPSIAIDPKGDLGNLLLSFPSLTAEEFRPWIDATEAARAGRTPEEHAAATAELWKRGLADWGQDGDRIRRLRESADIALYTPGSRVGRPLSVLRSLAAPLASPREALEERIASAASGILALVGVEADPLKSREHILLVKLIEAAWTAGQDLDLAELIRRVQAPPFARVGVFDLESFYPAKDRLELAMSLNHLLASPGFAAWTEGEPLEIARLLHTPAGKPRISILSIAHLDDRERMFFVTWLLGEVVAWMRTQPGTQSLRALLYMDEVMGFLPPIAAPPSKAPLLTLLKQARAFGLGVVLATQNPVDLDYKALSNAGTWLLGRLQTERDQARVLDGLEGSVAARGGGFERGKLERQLAGLGKRVFLLHSVHEDGPVLFQTRWALSYLRGPLTLEEIARLQPSDSARAAPSLRAPLAGASAPETPVVSRVGYAGRPVLPAGLEEKFVAVAGEAPAGARLLYRPALLGVAALRYADAKAGVDHFERVALLRELDDAGSWEAAAEVDAARLALGGEPAPGAGFAQLPAGLGKGSAERLAKALATHLAQARPLVLHRSLAAGLVSQPREEEGAFRVRVREALRERRDAALEKLRARYAPKLARAEQRVRSRSDELERQRSQRTSEVVGTAISVGATVLGALFGRKLGGTGTVGRATTAARGATRSAREHGDVARASEALAAAEAELRALDAEFQTETVALREAGGEGELAELMLRPRKTDTQVERVALLWRPYWLGADGLARPAFASAA
jgi:hypothetical protein